MKEKRRILAAIGLVAIFSLTTSTAALRFPTGTFVHGPRTLQFNDDGSFSWRFEDVVLTTGFYSVSGNQLTWTTDTYCADRKAEIATYTWTFDGQILTFQVVDRDSCSRRLAGLNGLPYTKQPQSPT